MPRPRYCTNPECPNFRFRATSWCVRNGTYLTAAHGRVQRYRCKHCHRGLSTQSESIYYGSKHRLDLAQVYSRLRGGSSQLDIAREMGCSRTAIGNAVQRLARQAMAAHLRIIIGQSTSGALCFDGLVSAVCSRDYASQITTLGDSRSELLLAMSHCVSERGGSRSESQRRRMKEKRAVWRPAAGALKDSISLLVRELAGFGSARALRIDTDEHPLYPSALQSEPRLAWHRINGLLEHRRTSGSEARTTSNPLFLMNYLDRMIRHRMKEHTRETIAVARNASAQMQRMWIFAWDHNTRQPMRVAGPDRRSRAEIAGVPPRLLARVRREFFSRRIAVSGIPVPESIRTVWRAELNSPPVRWRVKHYKTRAVLPAFAHLDLSRAHPHDW